LQIKQVSNKNYRNNIAIIYGRFNAITLYLDISEHGKVLCVQST